MRVGRPSQQPERDAVPHRHLRDGGLGGGGGGGRFGAVGGGRVGSGGGRAEQAEGGGAHLDSGAHAPCCALRRNGGATSPPGAWALRRDIARARAPSTSGAPRQPRPPRVPGRACPARPRAMGAAHGDGAGDRGDRSPLRQLFTVCARGGPGVRGGEGGRCGVGAQRTFYQTNERQRPNWPEYQNCGKQAEPSDELRLVISLIFEANLSEVMIHDDMFKA